MSWRWNRGSWVAKEWCLGSSFNDTQLFDMVYCNRNIHNLYVCLGFASVVEYLSAAASVRFLRCVRPPPALVVDVSADARPLSQTDIQANHPAPESSMLPVC